MAGKETMTNRREQLNQHYYQQALEFAEQFTDPTRSEFIDETSARYAFEQQAVLQKTEEKQVLGRKGLWSLLALLFCSCVLFYWQSGRYQGVTQGEAELQQFQQQLNAQSHTERNEGYILSLQNQLRANPNDGDLWFELAQAYTLNNDFDSAMICYQNAQRVLGQTAPIFGGMATVAYYRERHRLTPEVQQMIAQAFALDPHESHAHLILASEAFFRNAFAEAIEHWENVLATENRAIDRREIIKSIQQAKARLNTE